MYIFSKLIYRATLGVYRGLLRCIFHYLLDGSSVSRRTWTFQIFSNVHNLNNPRDCYASQCYGHISLYRFQHAVSRIASHYVMKETARKWFHRCTRQRSYVDHSNNRARLRKQLPKSQHPGEDESVTIQCLPARDATDANDDRYLACVEPAGWSDAWRWRRVTAIFSPLWIRRHDLCYRVFQRARVRTTNREMDGNRK